MRGPGNKWGVGAQGMILAANCRMCHKPFTVYVKTGPKKIMIGMSSVIGHYRSSHLSLFQPVSPLGRIRLETSGLLLQDKKKTLGKMASRKTVQQPGMAVLSVSLPLSGSEFSRRTNITPRYSPLRGPLRGPGLSSPVGMSTATWPLTAEHYKRNNRNPKEKP